MRNDDPAPASHLMLTPVEGCAAEKQKEEMGGNLRRFYKQATPSGVNSSAQTGHWNFLGCVLLRCRQNPSDMANTYSQIYSVVEIPEGRTTVDLTRPLGFFDVSAG
jgi:hypothetical protein